MVSQPTIFLVDDDAGVRRFVCVLLKSDGFSNVRAYESSQKFLQEAPLRDGDCVLLDIYMPVLDGLAVQNELNRRSEHIAVIVITGQADVTIAVKAMQAGAVDFIEKPFSNELLLSSVHRALAIAEQAEYGVKGSDDIRRLLELLTAREREVFDRIVQGWPNKIVAHDLKISPRTVEMHRAHMMDKMNAPNLGALIRMTVAAGIPLDAKEEARAV